MTLREFQELEAGEEVMEEIPAEGADDASAAEEVPVENTGAAGEDQVTTTVTGGNTTE